MLKAWELMYLCASAMPPGKEFGAHLSEYVHEVANSVGDSQIQTMALNTWNALKRSVKGGPRRVIPTQEEIEALLSGKKLTTIAFFLDETFEEVSYDMTTTVSDAVEVSYFRTLLCFYKSSYFCTMFKFGTEIILKEMQGLHC